MTQVSKLAAQMTNTTITENGMEAFHSSLNDCVDLFFQIGSSRGKDLIGQFMAAYQENPEYAMRIVLWGRDIRGGAGERETVRLIINGLAGAPNPELREVAQTLIQRLPEVGRWDDLQAAFGTPLESFAAELWVTAIEQGNGLAAKWAPRKVKKGARPLIKAAGVRNEKAWRRLIVPLSDTVEQRMCANEWSQITYSHVPSVAAARYQAAFYRHDPDGYASYRAKLSRGDADVKVNASAVFPYDIVKSLRLGDAQVADAQWKALPDYIGDSNARFMVVCDVSCSMNQTLGSGTVTAMDVSTSLAMYLAERNTSIFKDQFITFSERPQMQVIKGKTLKQRWQSVESAGWGANTDLQKTFKAVLTAAKRANLSQEDMPTHLLVISDMQFDHPFVQRRGTNFTAQEMAREMFSKAGYEVPQLVWWNVCDRGNNIPVTMHESGAALVSGASPAVVKGLLGGTLTPHSVMLDTIMSDRYAVA